MLPCRGHDSSLYLLLRIHIGIGQSRLAGRRARNSDKAPCHFQFLFLLFELAEFQFERLAQGSTQCGSEGCSNAGNWNERAECTADEGERGFGHSLEHTS